MRVGVTGAGGYVGSHLVESLTGQGHEVVSLSRPLGFRLGEPPRPGDLAGLDAVIHAAYDFSARGWAEIERVNVMGSTLLLDATIAAGVSRFVFLSSLAAYYGCRSMYGRGKVRVELEVLPRGGYVVRPGTIFGGKGGGLFQSLANLVARSSIIPLPDGGSQRLYLVHIDDLVGLLEKLIRLDLPDNRRLVTAACPEGRTLREILGVLAREQGVRRFFLPVPSPLLLWPLRAAEVVLGPRLPVRSDSLISLLYPNPAPDFSLPASLAGTRFRAFGGEAPISQAESLPR
jgi:NADH dehydrogenase